MTLWQFIKQFSKFTVTGATCFAIDFGLMVLLKEVFGVYYLAASGISFVVATCINYLISKHWVYDVKDKHAQFKELIVFIILSAIGLGINTCLLWVFTSKVGLNYKISKLIAGMIGSIYNYITRKLYLEK
ncbi:MAG: GtrA family protein [Firmicutes bacterium]|nr:GtrA family protein [Bacillota bacterium]